MAKIIRAVLYLLVFLVPLTFTTINSELFEFPKFILLISGTLVILVAWTISLYQTRNFKIKLTKIDYSILAILTTQGLATIFSIHPYTSFWGYYSRFHQGFLTTICYTIIYFAATKWLDYKSTQKLIKISIGTAFFVSLYAVLEHFGIDKTLWVQDVQNRVFSTLGQPNWLAAYLIPNLFFILYLRQTNKKHSLLLCVTFALLFTALLLTRSRSGLLGFVLAFLTYWLVTIRTFSFAKIKRSLFLYSTLLIPLFLFIGSPYSPSIRELIKRESQPASPVVAQGTALETGGTESGDIRKIVWTGALSLIKKYPLLGTGPETFAYTYYWVRPVAHNLTSEWDFLYNKAHNEYLNIAATSGLIGLAAYLAWHLLVFLAGFTQIPKTKKVAQEHDESLRAYYPVLSATIIGFAATNFFGFSVIPVYLMMILISALPTTFSQETIESSPITINTYLTTFVLACLVMIWPLRLFYADLLYARGKAYLDAGQPSAAAQLLQTAVSYRSSEDLYLSSLAEVNAQLASIAGTSKDPVEQTRTSQFVEKALALATTTHTHNPYHLNYFKSRAKVYITLATVDPKYNVLAKSELEEASQLAPTDPKLLYNLGLIYTRVGDLPNAERSLQKSLELKPNYPDPYYALTLLYEQDKQTAKIPTLLKDAKSNLATYSAQLKAKIDQYTNQ